MAPSPPHSYRATINPIRSVHPFQSSHILSHPVGWPERTPRWYNLLTPMNFFKNPFNIPIPLSWRNRRKEICNENKRSSVWNTQAYYAIYTTSWSRYLLLLTVNRFEFQSRSEAASEKEAQENERWEVWVTLGWKSVFGWVITDHFSVCGKGKSAIALTGIRVTDCLRGKNEWYSLQRAVGPT